MERYKEKDALSNAELVQIVQPKSCDAMSTDMIYALYDEWRTLENDLTIRKDKLVFAPILRNAVVYDVGCGIGVEMGGKSRHLIQQLRPFELQAYVGIDPYINVELLTEKFVMQQYKDFVFDEKFVRNDALQFLDNDNVKPGVVIANALFSEVLGIHTTAEELEYLDRLMKVIFQKTSRYSFGFGIYPDAVQSAQKAGFDVFVTDSREEKEKSIDRLIAFMGVESSGLQYGEREFYKKVGVGEFFMLKKPMTIENVQTNTKERALDSIPSDKGQDQ